MRKILFLIVCLFIANGAGIRDFMRCIKVDGKFTLQNNHIKQLGGLLEIFARVRYSL